ncbi:MULTISPECIES: flagellar motor switch protein FliG [unclassified Iodidimonas]|nr:MULTISPECIES: flagellar motor switch protein FliG [unclassified Iodidimonas]GAK32313.1 flagellar motor switch protein FliG [alpha proteobacterium Q-1]
MAGQSIVRDNYVALTGPEKASIMFLALGEKRAAPLLERLDEDEIRIVTRAMSGLGNITASVLEDLINRFTEQFAKGGSVVGSYESTERMLKAFLPDDKVGEIMNYIRGPAGRTTWEKLSSVNEHLLAKYLSGEHPQTVAVVLSKLNPDHSAKILPLLPRHITRSAMRRIVKLQSIPQEVVGDVEEVLHKELMLNYALAATTDSHEQLAEIFNRTDPKSLDDFIEDFERDMPDSAALVKQLMFTFDDLVELDPMSLGVLIRSCDTDMLVYALKGSKAPIRDMFIGQMSERAGAILRDSIETMGPVLARDVEQAKNNILQKAKNLAEAGAIVIQRGDNANSQVIY